MDLVGFYGRVKEFPNHFLVPIDFENLHFIGVLLAIAANYRVAVGESLPSAWVAIAAIGIFVVAAPGHRAIGCEFDGLVSVS